MRRFLTALALAAGITLSGYAISATQAVAAATGAAFLACDVRDSAASDRAVEDALAVGDLREDPGLHVVDDERKPRGLEGVLQRLGDIEPVETVHRSDATWTPPAPEAITRT